MNETDKLIEEQLKTLPPNLQQAINAVPWKTIAQDIGKANSLNSEQIESLEQEVMLALYNFENPNDLPENIERETGISEETSYKIATTVAEKILSVIEKKSNEQKNTVITTSVPEIPPTNLPVIEPAFAQDVIMVKKGEVAHTVNSKQYTVDSESESTSSQSLPEAKPEPKVNTPLPDYHYPGGKDPYREPLQ